MSEWKGPMEMVVAEYEARLDAYRVRVAELEAKLEMSNYVGNEMVAELTAELDSLRATVATKENNALWLELKRIEEEKGEDNER